MKENFRIEKHPVLQPKKGRKVKFYFQGKELEGYEGEPIIVALRAEGIMKLRSSAKTHLPWGPYCMQGRCASCLMRVNGKPNTMVCVTLLEEGMKVEPQGSAQDHEHFKHPPLPTKRIDLSPLGTTTKHPECDIAVIGAGPAGLSAGIIAKEAGTPRVVVLDDKPFLGGQLRLQTHTFFGTQALGAGIRGFVIAEQLAKHAEELDISTRLNSTVIGIYPDNFIAFKDEDRLNFLVPKKIIVATGASEKHLTFEGNYLPGVIGAGAAQTFMNLHYVKPGKRVLIIGGGNIGVILAYQLLQTDIEVVGVVEAQAKLGAYQVHIDKIRSLGVPIFTRHTIVRALGSEHVTGAVIQELDEKFTPQKGTEKEFAVDTICLAVGLNPLSELLWQAGCKFDFIPELGETVRFDKHRRTTNPDIFVAGDCSAIGEASIARLEGQIAGLTSARDLGFTHQSHENILGDSFKYLDHIQKGTFGKRLGTGKAKSIALMNNEKPELVNEKQFAFSSSPFNQKITLANIKKKLWRPIIECDQDIPCNPCEASCEYGAIIIGSEINQPPTIDYSKCTGCGKCLPSCPGRAIRLLQFNASETTSRVKIPFEFDPPTVGAETIILDINANNIGKGKVVKVEGYGNSLEVGMVTVEIPKETAFKAKTISLKLDLSAGKVADEKEAKHKSDLVCRCEEVETAFIEHAIENGYTSAHEIKRLLRVGMGPCRGLGCGAIVEGLLKRKAKKSPEELLAAKQQRRTVYRPPIKRITLGEAAALRFSQEEMKVLHEIEEKRTTPLDVLEKLNPIPPRRASMKKKVVIIGGGISGVFTAWWLAKLGWSDILVVEKEFLSAGATGACLGGIRTGFATSNKIQRAKKGLEIYRDAEKIIGKPVGWFQGGYIYLAFDEQTKISFEKSAEQWERDKVPYKFIKDENQLRELVPGIEAEKIVSAVFFEEAGGANPFLATFNFAESAKEMGAEFMVGAEVAGIEHDKQRVKAVALSDGTFIEAEHIVNAAGSFATKIAKMAGFQLSPMIWIERHGSLITEKQPLWLDPLVVSYHPKLSGYWQQKRMEKGVTEGELVACYSPPDPVKGYNTYSDIYFLSRMAQSILACQPGLADLGIVRNLAHHYVGRESGVPLIGQSPLKGFWFNIAKKGHGFMCAPGDSLCLAETMVTGKLHPWITECTIDENKEHTETMV